MGAPVTTPWSKVNAAVRTMPPCWKSKNRPIAALRCQGGVERDGPGVVAEWMYVGVSEVCSAHRHEVSGCAEVGLQVGDQVAASAHGERDGEFAAGLGARADRDPIAVDARCGGRRRHLGGLVVAGHGEVGAEREPWAVGDMEIGDCPVGPRRQRRKCDRPRAVRIQSGVHVVIHGEFAVHHDQVQLPFVQGSETVYPVAVRPVDDEPVGPAGGGKRSGVGDHVVAVSGRDHSCTDRRRLHLRRPARGRSDRGAHTGADAEGGGQDDREPCDARAGLHDASS